MYNRNANPRGGILHMLLTGLLVLMSGCVTISFNTPSHSGVVIPNEEALWDSEEFGVGISNNSSITIDFTNKTGMIRKRFLIILGSVYDPNEDNFIRFKTPKGAISCDYPNINYLNIKHRTGERLINPELEDYVLTSWLDTSPICLNKTSEGTSDYLFFILFDLDAIEKNCSISICESGKYEVCTTIHAIKGTMQNESRCTDG